MSTVFFVLTGVTMVAVLVTLGVGVIGMAQAGEIGRKKATS